jgi:LPS sulfotransferase NodH
MLEQPHPSVPVEPHLTYIIASTMRTGSYLLCEGLEATGYAGHPQEIFCPERHANYCGCWQLPANTSFTNFLRTATQKCSTANGICGMKIHWHHVEPLALQHEVGKPWRVLLKLFPGAKYIHLRRRDRRAQAISWFRAQITNEWWRVAGYVNKELTGKALKFYPTEIRRMEIELERQQKGWDEFFAGQSVPVLVMEYEALAADYRGEIARVLAFLGQDPGLAKIIPEPRLICQSDAMTDEWHRLMDEKFPVQGER